MNEGQSQFLERMKIIKQEFETHLPEKIDDIIEQWQNLKINGWKREVVTDCHKSIHKLTGSSGIMGYMQISEICGNIEDGLQRVLELNEPLNSKQFELMDNYMKELKNQLSKITK